MENVITVSQALGTLLAETGRTGTWLSKECGMSRVQISNILTGKTKDPSFSTIKKLANAFGKTPNFFLGQEGGMTVLGTGDIHQLADQIICEVSTISRKTILTNGLVPSTQEMIKWWYEQGGRLGSGDQMTGRFDLFHVPDCSGSNLVPHSMGARSLATRRLNTPNPAKVVSFMKTLCPRDLERMSHSYYQASIAERPSSKIRAIEGTDPETNEVIQLEYHQTLLPTYLPNNELMILNYSEEILYDTSKVPRIRK